MTDLSAIERKRALLQPVAELCKNPEFTKYAKELREDLAALKELPWALSAKQSGEHTKLLDSCGLGWPQDPRELYECFIAVKAVVHFTEKRLRAREANAVRYYQLTEKMQKIVEAERGLKDE